MRGTARSPDIAPCEKEDDGTIDLHRRAAPSMPWLRHFHRGLARPVYRLTDIALSNWYLIRREQIRDPGSGCLGGADGGRQVDDLRRCRHRARRQQRQPPRPQRVCLGAQRPHGPRLLPRLDQRPRRGRSSHPRGLRDPHRPRLRERNYRTRRLRRSRARGPGRGQSRDHPLALHRGRTPVRDRRLRPRDRPRAATWRPGRKSQRISASGRTGSRSSAHRASVSPPTSWR